MPEPKNPNPRTTRQKTTAKQPPQEKFCHIHDKVDSWRVYGIRENVCVPESEYPLTEFEGKNYCLFHLPTKEKDIAKFEKIFQTRLEKTDQQCAAIEAEFPDDEAKQEEAKSERNINYNFRYVWFPSTVDLTNRKFSASAYFRSATFSASAYFRSATFSASAFFISATFRASAYFSSATFSASAYFSSATFSEYAYFRSATFSASAYFSSATFSASADFSAATFSASAYFSAATFSASADFSAAKFFGISVFIETVFIDVISFSATHWAIGAQGIFRDTYFADKVDFQYSKIDSELRFLELRQGENNTLNFNTISFGIQGKIDFYSVLLQPISFRFTDLQKFNFSNVKWEISEKNRNKSIEEKVNNDELKILYRKLANVSLKNYQDEDAAYFFKEALIEKYREKQAKIDNRIGWLYYEFKIRYVNFRYKLGLRLERPILLNSGNESTINPRGFKGSILIQKIFLILLIISLSSFLLLLAYIFQITFKQPDVNVENLYVLSIVPVPDAVTIAFMAVLVSALGTISTLIFNWRKEIRDNKETKLRIEKLELELKQLKTAESEKEKQVILLDKQSLSELKLK